MKKKNFCELYETKRSSFDLCVCIEISKFESVLNSIMLYCDDWHQKPKEQW